MTTVSPRYAREIQTEAEGMGLHGLLRARRGDLIGITNGIDETVWDPASDRHVPAPYGASTLDSKSLDKRRLQERFALATDPAALLLAVVSRLTEQKGLDLLLAQLPLLLERGGQLAVLGAGQTWLEAGFRGAAASHPGRVGWEGNAEQRQSQQQPRGDRDNDQPGIDQSGSAEPYPAVDEIEGTVKKMGAGHQDHARADCDQAQ